MVLQLFELRIGGPVGQRLGPLIEMFRMEEKALVYAERFVKYYEKINQN